MKRPDITNEPAKTSQRYNENLTVKSANSTWINHNPMKTDASPN